MAFVNRSPWIHQLDRSRASISLSSDTQTDVAIVGAGIAGVSTAFFTLHETSKKITLIEGGRLAHGATGHNAGQVTTYFERPLHDIAEEFGPELTKEAQEAVEHSFELLEHMYSVASLSIPFSRFLGHAGIVDFDRVMSHLKDNETREKLVLSVEEFLVSENAPFLKLIPEQYARFYKVVPQQKIFDLLETSNPKFTACLSSPKGCINSALFCQEIILYLQKTFPTRFSFYEHTHINKVILKHDHALLDAVHYEIHASRVVLCTNGFETLTIINESGLDINTRFHHTVKGIIGFMSGYLKAYEKPPIAISYITKGNSQFEGEYYYLTRREFEQEGTTNLNLISIGGPEVELDDTAFYTKDRDYPEEAQESIDTFIRSTCEDDDVKPIEYQFKWHGLMGYTTNGIRLIGIEPKNPVLLYNLGCNGIGILPSIYGGKRISNILVGKKLLPSIFDPKIH
jgi:glycine/D-amino acid oxidase-like deaminating enzyme